MNEFLKGCVFYFVNHILNKIPSRRIRMFSYTFLSKGNISRRASIGLGVRILDIRNVRVGKHTNINFGTILDGRGEGIEIGENVDIAPQVNIWSLEHEVNSKTHQSKSGKVIIESGCWLANRATILPSTHIYENCVISAGSLIKGVYAKNSIVMGRKASVRRERTVSLEGSDLPSIRLFR